MKEFSYFVVVNEKKTSTPFSPQSTPKKNNNNTFLAVINFFASTDSDDECLSDDARRLGLCLNTYECRIQGM